MDRYEIEREIELFYLRCPDCYKHLDRIEYFEEIRKVMYKTLVYFECPECKETYSGYRCKIDDEGHIEWFELIK